MKIYKSNEIYTKGGCLSGYLHIKDGKIINITKQLPEEAKCEDYSEYRIIPGIIDIHNHGFGGWSVTDEISVEGVLGYSRALATVGVTGVLATAKIEAFESISEAMKQQAPGAIIYGIHSEGPFWARGGENTIGLTWPAPSIEMTEDYIEKAKGNLKMMAIAPELKGADEVIKLLKRKGIKVACCHTKAKAKELFKNQQVAHFDIATHLGNGMQGIHHRDVGALGALLLMDDIMYELIGDLNHICADMIKIMFKLQPYDKFCLISDSNFIAGLQPGTYMRYGREMYADEKGLILNSDGRICGSGKWVLYNMGQLVNVVGVDLEKVVEMASLNPAKFLGINDKTGSIDIGLNADFVIIDENYECLVTVVHGKEVFNRNEKPALSYYNREVKPII